jgi:hypothetical protein
VASSDAIGTEIERKKVWGGQVSVDALSPDDRDANLTVARRRVSRTTTEYRQTTIYPYLQAHRV